MYGYKASLPQYNYMYILNYKSDINVEIDIANGHLSRNYLVVSWAVIPSRAPLIIRHHIHHISLLSTADTLACPRGVVIQRVWWLSVQVVNVIVNLFLFVHFT